MAPMIRSPTHLPARAVLCHNCRILRPGLGLGANAGSNSGSNPWPSSPLHVQRRWIGLKFLQKKKDAQKAWDAQAKEIAAGTTKHLFDELQDRGLVKDVVG